MVCPECGNEHYNVVEKVEPVYEGTCHIRCGSCGHHYDQSYHQTFVGRKN